MSEFGIGAPVPREADGRLLTGAGRYSIDGWLAARRHTETDG